jgi:hypothetical protein
MGSPGRPNVFSACRRGELDRREMAYLVGETARGSVERMKRVGVNARAPNLRVGIVWLPKRHTNTNSQLDNPVRRGFSSLLTKRGISDLRMSFCRRLPPPAIRGFGARGSRSIIPTTPWRSSRKGFTSPTMICLTFLQPIGRRRLGPLLLLRHDRFQTLGTPCP